MLYRYVLMAALAGIAHAAERPTRLYVASYAGTVSTVQLKAGGLEVTHIATECAVTPSWLTLDQHKKLLYCTDRGLAPGNGTLNTFKTSHDGKLVHLGRVPTIPGTVSSVTYGKKDNGLAIASYQNSTFQTFDASDPTAPKLQQTWTYALDKPGPVLPNQEAPHPHQAVLDPTGKYVLVPDLGADIVRLFEVDSRSLLLKPLEPLVALPPGTGPRHVAFHTTKDRKTLLYVLGELANTITTYELSYRSNRPPKVKLLQSTSTFGEGNSAPNGTSAAEVQVTVNQDPSTPLSLPPLQKGDVLMRNRMTAGLLSFHHVTTRHSRFPTSTQKIPLRSCPTLSSPSALMLKAASSSYRRSSHPVVGSQDISRSTMLEHLWLLVFRPTLVWC